jgi:hypothetical protein
MVAEIQRTPEARRPTLNFAQLYENAVRGALDTRTRIFYDIARDGWEAVLGMAEEYVQTGKPVCTRWATRCDRRR